MPHPPEDNVISLDFGRRPIMSAVAEITPAIQHKLEVFRQLIEQGLVTVALDARKEGVQVPKEFTIEPELRLNFSHRFGHSDFSYDEKSVSATLTFPEGYFHCVVPWDAVFAMQSQVSNQGIVWPDDAPDTIRQPSHLRLVRDE